MPKATTLTVKIIDQDITDILPKGELSEAQKNFVKFLARLAVQEYIKETSLNAVRQESAQDRILRLREVIKVTGLSRASIYLQMNRGNFPRSVNLGTRSVGWKESQVMAWLEER